MGRTPLLALLVAVTGCQQLFGLDDPTRHTIDAPTVGRDAAHDDGGIGGLDAEPIADAMPDSFMVVCPGTYQTVPGLTSRYRLIMTNGKFAAQHADCNDDHPGNTHLASLDGAGELVTVRDLFIQSGSHYVGMVQAPNQANPTAGWIAFDGGALPANQWANTQPDDEPTVQEDNDENLGVLENAGLRDVDGQETYRAICECDGRPIDATAASYLP